MIANQLAAHELSLTGCHWIPASIDVQKAFHLQQQLQIPLPLARTLVHRRYKDAAHVQSFLNPSLEDIPDPRAMLNMERAEYTLLEALQKGTPLRIVGDYDCDGTTGLITLLQTFRLLNPTTAKNISYHVPDRERDGYGLNPRIVEQAARDGVKVLVSVDIGITAHQEWEQAHRLGLTGICIDHHTVLGSQAPEHAIVLCPKQAGCNYQEKELAACGLSLQLARVLLDKNPRREAILESLCKLVAIGTVADMVPLNSLANRAIVKAGLRGLSAGSKNVGLEALLNVAGLGKMDRSRGIVTGQDLGFKLGPRINAAGRMEGTTLQVISLLDAESPAEAQRLAEEIDEMNRQRQEVQQLLVEQLLDKIKQDNSQDLVYVYGGPVAEGWHQGVIGIAASKIVESFGRPALVCTIRGETAHGSARSIKQLNIVQALTAVAPGLLLKYGGHAAAAGFSLEARRLDELRAKINDYAREKVSAQDLIPTKVYEDELIPTDVTVNLAQAFRLLEPYGVENPKPLFTITGNLLETRILKDKHLKLRLSGNGTTIDCIWWQQARLQATLPVNKPVKLLGKIDVNEWQGRVTPQVVVEDAQLVR
jgi:single-stranded-DNA-specific exonuclease